MEIREIRQWLGLYFLLITVILGGYILLFKHTVLFPMSEEAALSVFQIIVPVLIGQLTIIFQWYSSIALNPDDKSEQTIITALPIWVVKAPPILISCFIFIAIITLIIGNMGATRSDWAMTAGTFKMIITFCVSILNATTIFIVSSLFKSSIQTGVTQVGVE